MGNTLLSALASEVEETCKVVVEQRSPLHGARYWDRQEYKALKTAIGHLDPFQTVLPAHTLGVKLFVAGKV